MNNLNNKRPKGFSIFFIVGLISTISAIKFILYFDFLGILAWQLIFITSFIFSFIFTIASYYLINQSIAYALKTIITSLIITSTAFFVCSIPLILIIIAIGLIAFKKYAVLNNTQKAFLCFFTAPVLFYFALMIFVIIMEYSIYDGGDYIHIDEIDAPAGENIRYVEITKEELEEYPSVGKAINTCLETNEYDCEIYDRIQAKDFFDKKRHESAYLFSITDAGVEENLKKEIITDELRNIFESNGFTISENATTSAFSFHLNNGWDIYERNESNYEILKEEGELNVYYVESRWFTDTIFKTGEVYYKIDYYYYYYKSYYQLNPSLLQIEEFENVYW